MNFATLIKIVKLGIILIRSQFTFLLINKNPFLLTNYILIIF
jgi:hypothetical protein